MPETQHSQNSINRFAAGKDSKSWVANQSPFGDEGIYFGVGVATRELYYGDQMDHLEDVNQQLPYDIWELHELWKKEPPKKG